MGLFDWLKQFFGLGPSQTPRFTAPGICPYCGEALRTLAAQQCFTCGATWHSSGPRPTLPVSTIPPVRATVAPSPSASPPKVLPPKLTQGLELGTFAPLTSQQVRSELKGVGSLWGNPWFGRRDLIPPVSDKRTELIDRGMVGQGLITPEELDEIHRVGDLMDLIRPDLAVAGQMANAVVARDDAERAAIKQKKKEEAARKKFRHAEEVRWRRENDIVFLGRGVSRGLADRASNIERLQQFELPLLSTPAEVAEALGLSISQLRWLAFHNEAATRTHYISFTVPKRSGGERRLAAPHARLAKCQDWILRYVLDRVPAHICAHGFVRGRSIATNAAVHVGSDLVLNADLEDFFPTIEFSRVKGAFRSLGYSPVVATIFALLCTEAPRSVMQYDGKTYYVATGKRCLPQGAATSPALSNLVARRLDKRLAGIAMKLGWKYTRYADDLSFSTNGDAAKNVGYLLARLRHITQEEGFRVNEKKTRVQRQNSRQSVTGVVVNERTGAPRPLVRRLRAILHRAKFEGLDRQNRDNLPHFRSWLSGMIAYVNMLCPEQGRKLRADYDALLP